MAPEWIPVIVTAITTIGGIIVAVVGARSIAKREIRAVDNTQLEQVAELEKKLAVTEKALADEVEARARLGDDLLALRKWRDDYLAEEAKRRESAKHLAQKDRAETLRQLGEISTTLAVQSKTLDNLLQMGGGFHGLAKALHGRNGDGA